MVEFINKIIILTAFNFIITNNIYCQNKIDSLIYFSIEKQIDSNFDSIIKHQSIAKIDVINRTRVLLFNEVGSQNKDIQLIANFQDFLNNISNDGNIQYSGLSNEENLILYVYIQKWDSILNIIPKINHPYKINNLSLYGENILIQREIGIPKIILIKKSKFINNQVYNDILNSDLSEEQKDFLKIFIPNYFGYKFIQNNTKVKVAYKNFKKKYPKSLFLKYICGEKRCIAN